MRNTIKDDFYQYGRVALSIAILFLSLQIFSGTAKAAEYLYEQGFSRNIISSLTGNFSSSGTSLSIQGPLKSRNSVLNQSGVLNFTGSSGSFNISFKSDQGLPALSSVVGNFTGSGNTRYVSAVFSFPFSSGATVTSTENDTVTLDNSGRVIAVQFIGANSDGERFRFNCVFNPNTGAVSGDPSCASAYGVGIFDELFSQTLNIKQAIQAANAVQAVAVSRAESRQIVNKIARHIDNVLAPNHSSNVSENGQPKMSFDGSMVGLSAGDSDLTSGVWASFSHSWVNNNWSVLRAKSEINSTTIGGDIKYNDNVVFGITFTYQASGTTKSADSDAGSGTLDAANYTFVPYAALSLMDGRIVIDAMAGGGFGNADSKRFEVSGSYNSHRWLLGTHATYNNSIDNWTFATKLGWLMAYDWASSFTENDGTFNSRRSTKIGEVSIGERIGYTTEFFEPYLGATYSYDPLLTPNAVGTTASRLDRNDVEGLIGINFFPIDRLTAAVEVSSTVLRRNEKNTSVMFSGRYAF